MEFNGNLYHEIDDEVHESDKEKNEDKFVVDGDVESNESGSSFEKEK